MKISGVDVKDLKEQYGTPLYIYDENHLIKNMEGYLKYFKSDKFETEVLFASKALNIKEIIRLCKKEGMSLDCVSKAEIYTALSVGFNPSNIYFHGNNKSYDDLVYAIENNIGVIVCDNLMELEQIEVISKELKKVVNVMFRMNVGVDAHTHKFIITAHVDSKFGVLYGSDDYKKIMELIKKSKNVKFIGFHSHIGSQIFDLNAFSAAASKIVSYLKDFDEELQINLGGGYGVHYTDDDKPIPFDIVSKTLINTVEAELSKQNIKIKKLSIEPGRSIVAEAGYTLYTIGYTKKTPNKEYYFIDGGMTDNIRPALYQAKYDCDIVGKENAKKDHIVTIAGKCCESGDLIIENYPLPEAKMGDLLITYTTGAYGYSMASNYNKALYPAIVFVKDGKSKLVVRRQTLEELIEREI
ncbi:MAG: diaminopimelate decarboxylase [Acholeplasmatales bacterium]|nr:diaminopimelate decarboxylase [Acholeplasmatales bacterium]